MKFDQKPDNFTNETKGEKHAETHHTGEVVKKHEETPEAVNEGEEVEAEKTKKHFLGLPRWAWYTILVCIVVLFVAFWLRYIHPSATDMVQTGYITNIEKRGLIFHTGEGGMAVQMNYADSARMYERNFNFSVTNPKVYQELQNLKDSGRLVTVHYKTFGGSLPWRGSSTNIVTSVRDASNP